MRGVGRCTLEGLDHDRFDHVVADVAPPQDAGRRRGRRDELRQSGSATCPPSPDCSPAGRDLNLGAIACGAGEDDLGAQCQRLGRRMPARPALERGAFLSAQVDLDRESPGMASSDVAYNTGQRGQPKIRQQ